MTWLDWLEFCAQVGALALGATIWFVLAGWCLTCLLMDLRFRELLVPLWCFLSGDEATVARLDGILAGRQEAYQPRHALPPGQDRRDPEIWLYMRHWPPYF